MSGLPSKRILILGLMGVAAVGVYLTAKLCAGSIVAYVVEETLIQKAPPGVDSRSPPDSGSRVDWPPAPTGLPGSGDSWRLRRRLRGPRG